MSNLNVNTITSSQGVVLPGHIGTGNYPSGALGKVIFDTAQGEIRVYNGSAWVGLSNEYDVDVLIVGGGGGGGASFGGGGGGGCDLCISIVDRFVTVVVSKVVILK